MSNMARRGEFMPIAEVAAILGKFCASGRHTFWPAGISLQNDKLFDLSLVRGHRQLTDVYLLGLAVARGGRLVTFDRGISLGAVKRARRQHLEVIGAAA